MFSLLETRNQGTSGTEVRGTPDKYESLNRSLSSETPPRDETVLELGEIKLSSEVEREIQTLSVRMKSSPQEVLEMSLREHFCLPRPQKWKKDSWIQSEVVYEQS